MRYGFNYVKLLVVFNPIFGLLWYLLEVTKFGLGQWNLKTKTKIFSL